MMICTVCALTSTRQIVLATYDVVDVLGYQGRDSNSLPHEGIMCVRPLPLTPARMICSALISVHAAQIIRIIGAKIIKFVKKQDVPEN